MKTLLSPVTILDKLRNIHFKLRLYSYAISTVKIVSNSEENITSKVINKRRQGHLFVILTE